VVPHARSGATKTPTRRVRVTSTLGSRIQGRFFIEQRDTEQAVAETDYTSFHRPAARRAVRSQRRSFLQASVGRARSFEARPLRARREE
jgi:hypothetical protein